LTAKRLIVAIALAPLGVTTTVLLLIILLGMDRPTDFLDSLTGLDFWMHLPVLLAAVTGLGYVAGAALLPVFFMLQRFGKRGWPFYVPIAAVAGAGMGAIMDWPTPFSSPLGFYSVCSVAGALSGGIFSVALAWRSKTTVGREVTPTPGSVNAAKFILIGVVMAVVGWESWETFRLLLR
jgi:hypothetical protein